METEFFTVNLKSDGEENNEIEIVVDNGFAPYLKNLDEVKNKIAACVKDIVENNITTDLEGK